MARGEYYFADATEAHVNVDIELTPAVHDFLLGVAEWARKAYTEAIICHPRVLGVYFGSSPMQKHVRLVMRGWRLR